MSKAFKKESDTESGDDSAESMPISVLRKNYVTPLGFKMLQDELRHLLATERPKIVETVRWAAGNGDRSENGDYIYGKKRLREIDRRVRYLTKQMENAEIIDPRKQQSLKKVYFGATVTFQCRDGNQQTVTLVGVDEANLTEGKISWISPVATALFKTAVGDIVELKTPQDTQQIEIKNIVYQIK